MTPGRSQSFVAQYARTWREYHDTQHGQTFGALVRLVQKGEAYEGQREDIMREAQDAGLSVATVQDRWMRERQTASLPEPDWSSAESWPPPPDEKARILADMRRFRQADA